MNIDRRTFVQSSVGMGAGSWLGARDLSAGIASSPLLAEDDGRQAAPFRLAYAPHFGMFRNLAGEDPVAELRFMAAQGFRALEDNGMKARPIADQERIATEMQRLGMRMGVFVAHTIGWTEPNLTDGNAEKRARFITEIRESVDVARRVNAKWMTVVPGMVDRRLELSYQTANVVEALREAAGILEPHGLVMVLEPLNTLRDHPGQFLQRIPQAYMICRAVNSPSCKILFDVYHQQITEGNLIPNLDAAWDEIGYIQVGDNPGRKEPTTGEINFRNIFRHLHGRGRDRSLPHRRHVLTTRPSIHDRVVLIPAVNFGPGMVLCLAFRSLALAWVRVKVGFECEFECDSDVSSSNSPSPVSLSLPLRATFAGRPGRCLLRAASTGAPAHLLPCSPRSSERSRRDGRRRVRTHRRDTRAYRIAQRQRGCPHPRAGVTAGHPVCGFPI
jgi:hydroxypyruvate isomerase